MRQTLSDAGIDPAKAIEKARFQLMLHPETAFFSYLLSNLRTELSTGIPTAATNGLRIMFNPDWISDLTQEELTGLVLHETEHVAYGHVGMPQAHGLDPRKFNIAADHLINVDALDRGFQLPADGHWDFKYRGWSVFQIYNDLQDPPSQGNGWDIDLELAETKEEQAEIQEAVEEVVLRAAIQARMAGEAGSIPKDIQIALDEQLNPQLPWSILLQDELTALAKTDYTYRKPSRKYLPDLYVPTQYSDTLGKVAVVLDVSGSINHEWVKQFLAEIKYLWDTMKPEGLQLLSFNTRIILNKEYNHGDEFEAPAVCGGGGTYFHPIVPVVSALDPTVLIVFTDGEFEMPSLRPITCPIFWIKFGNHPFNPPAGKVINFQEKQ